MNIISPSCYPNASDNTKPENVEWTDHFFVVILLPTAELLPFPGSVNQKAERKEPFSPLPVHGQPSGRQFQQGEGGCPSRIVPVCQARFICLYGSFSQKEVTHDKILLSP